MRRTNSQNENLTKYINDQVNYPDEKYQVEAKTRLQE